MELSTAKTKTFANLHENDIAMLCLYAREILMQEPMILQLNAPISIVGDLRGQYYDLLRIFCFNEERKSRHYSADRDKRY